MCSNRYRTGSISGIDKRIATAKFLSLPAPDVDSLWGTSWCSAQATGNETQPCAPHHCTANERCHYNRAPITSGCWSGCAPTRPPSAVCFPLSKAAHEIMSREIMEIWDQSAEPSDRGRNWKTTSRFQKVEFFAPRMFGLSLPLVTSCPLVNSWFLRERHCAHVSALDFNAVSLLRRHETLKRSLRPQHQTNCWFFFPSCDLMPLRWGGKISHDSGAKYKRPHWSEPYINKHGHLLRGGRGGQVHWGSGLVPHLLLLDGLLCTG